MTPFTAKPSADETASGVSTSWNALAGQASPQSTIGPDAGRVSTSGSVTSQSTALAAAKAPMSRRSTGVSSRSRGKQRNA